MRRINKSREPRTLRNYRASLSQDQQVSSSAYNNFQHKGKTECNANIRDNLRKKLLEDQGYICCYCMSRISCQNSKIEHFEDQSTNRPLQLQYSNMYIACKGNEGSPHKCQCCDTFKGNSNLAFVNFNNHIESNIKYKKSGHIYSDITSLNDDIESILNLNETILKNNRRNMLETLITSMNGHYGKRWKKSNVTHEINRYKNKDSSGKLKVYCQMIIYYLTVKKAQL